MCVSGCSGGRVVLGEFWNPLLENGSTIRLAGCPVACGAAGRGGPPVGVMWGIAWDWSGEVPMTVVQAKGRNPGNECEDLWASSPSGCCRSAARRTSDQDTVETCWLSRCPVARGRRSPRLLGGAARAVRARRRRSAPGGAEHRLVGQAGARGVDDALDGAVLGPSPVSRISLDPIGAPRDCSTTTSSGRDGALPETRVPAVLAYLRRSGTC